MQPSAAFCPPLELYTVAGDSWFESDEGKISLETLQTTMGKLVVNHNNFCKKKLDGYD
jgi:hypothetical protein